MQKTRVKVDVENPLREAGCVAATLNAWSTNSVVQITSCTVMQKVSHVQIIQHDCVVFSVC